MDLFVDIAGVHFKNSIMPASGTFGSGQEYSEFFSLDLQMFYQTCRAVKIPVIGIRGITILNDALEFIMTGATDIAVGIANFNNPYTMPEIIEQLESYMKENHITDLEEIRGGVSE